jgi:hypothetical protein
MVPYNVFINRFDGYVIINIVVNFSLLTNYDYIYFCNVISQKI